MAEVDFDSCPIGIRNTDDIKYTNERLELVMQRLEEKIDDVKSSVSSIDSRLDDMEKKIDDIQSQLPEAINEEIKKYNNANVMSLVKWIVVTLCGSVVITIVTRLIANALAL